MNQRYFPASICLQGHVIDSTEQILNEHCPNCGSAVISKCPVCNVLLRGHPAHDGYVFIGDYQHPYYCFNCASPLPWTQLILDNAIELLSLDAHLDAETKSIIMSSIPNLIVEGPSTPLAAAKFKKFIEKADQLVKDGMKQLLITVISDVVKSQIL